MENKVYCKSEIARKTKIYIILMFLSIISLILLIVAFIPVRKGLVEKWEYYGKHFGYQNFEAHEGIVKNIYGEIIFDFHNNWSPYVSDRIEYTGPGEDYNLIFMIVFVVCGFIFAVLSNLRRRAKKSTLELNTDGIQGKVKKLFSSKSINQPFEHIDNLYIRKNIIDIITGGKTIVISSGGSKIKFSCVANAQEFVDKTLEELKKYKESANSKAEKVPEASSGNAMDDLLKLKSLLDQGLIT